MPAHRRRMLPPIQEVIFYAHFHGTPFSNQLPPIKTQKTILTSLAKPKTLLFTRKRKGKDSIPVVMQASSTSSEDST